MSTHASQPTDALETLCRNGRSEWLDKEFKLEGNGAPISERLRDGAVSPEIPKAFQGDEIKSPKELSLGDKVYDSTYQRHATVIKRYRYSVKLEWTDALGRPHAYGQSLHGLRRIV